MEDPKDNDGWEDMDRPPLKDLMFDQWATLPVESMPPLISDILQGTLAAFTKPNKKMRKDLKKGLTDIILSLMANLMHLHKKKPDGAVLVIQAAHKAKTRYDRSGFRKLPKVLKVMESQGHIIKHEAVFKVLRTTIEAIGPLKQHLLSPEVTLSDIIRAEGEEAIRLMARPYVSRIGGRKQPKVPISYQDNAETLSLRAKVDRIDRFLHSHRIELKDSPQPAFRLYRLFTLRSPNDVIAFNLHGRLYGGFWMNLHKSERHLLRIDGEPVADLDYSNMFPRLAYHHVGKEPPEGDLYGVPGLEGYREGAKGGLSALLSYGKEMQSLPSRLKEKLPEGWTASTLKAAYAAHHPRLVPLFGKDLGLDLMFAESRILMAILQWLMEKGIPALPMHDGVMVPVSCKEEGMGVMRETAIEIGGVKLPATEKAIEKP